jgi:acetyltransferase-like isoleucine patch superfamily enzyme
MFWHKVIFRFKERYSSILIQSIRLMYWRSQGMRVGSGVSLPQIYVTWPHQLQLGNNCKLEQGVFFKFDGIWKKGPSILIGERTFLGAYVEFNIREKISLGADCLIASGCKFIDHDHGFASRDFPINVQADGIDKVIVVEDDVWLGVNVVVLKGVHVGRGAIVAAGSVVSKSIPSYEIWAGIPARKISERPL